MLMKILRICLFLLVSIGGVAQINPTVFEPNYFRYPLDIAPKLNANFGEIRPNHYHMGIDLSTGGKENLPIFAVADGYIARVKIEEGGFGNAIYLNHPNGTTSLYAHLNQYASPIAQYIKQQQYALESWSVDLMLPPGYIAVTKGDVIGFSGNTGASEGPHVHFEIRDTQTEICINPLLYGLGIQDVVHPTVFKLAVYDANYSIYEQTPMFFPVKATKEGLMADILQVRSDKIRISLMASDKINGFPQHFGIYQALLSENDKIFAGFKMQSIGYNRTRYLNAHVDVQTLKKGGGAFQSLFAIPSDRSGIYIAGLHAFALNNTLEHHFTLKVTDAAGNATDVKIRLQRSDNIARKPYGNKRDEMMPGAVNVFDTSELELYLPESCLYDTIHFIYNSAPNNIVGSFSNMHKLHTPTVLLQDSCTVRIKASKAIPAGLGDVMLMVMNVPGKQIIQKAVFSHGMFAAKFRDFGTCYLMVDNTPPVITGLKNNANLLKASQINLFVTDNFKKIKQFRAELDGRFLMFSQRGNRFTYNFDENCGSGEHNIKITVRDIAGNQTVQTFHFTR